MMGSGRADDAARWLERTLLSSVRTLGEGSSLTVLRRNELALHYKGLGQGDKAEPLLRKQISIVERFAPPGDPLSLSVALNNLATLLYAGGRAVDAEPLLVRAVEVARGAGKKTVASWKNAIGAVRTGAYGTEGACALSGKGAVGMFRLVAKNKGLAFDNLEQKKSEKDIAQGTREECLRELENFKANLVAVRASLGHGANRKRGGGGGGGGAGGGSGDESGGGGESRLRASSSVSTVSSVSVHTTDDSSDDGEGGGAGKGGETKAELDGRMTAGTAGIAARMMAAARKRMAERNGEGSDGGDEKEEETKGLSHAASLAKLRGSPSADSGESDIDEGASGDLTGEELTKWKVKVIKQVKTEQEDKREDRRRARKERAKARRKKKKEKQNSTTEADTFEASNDTKVDKWAGLRQRQQPAEAKLIREKYERLRKAFDLVDVRLHVLHGVRQFQPQFRPFCALHTLP